MSFEDNITPHRCSENPTQALLLCLVFEATHRIKIKTTVHSKTRILDGLYNQIRARTFVLLTVNAD